MVTFSGAYTPTAEYGDMILRTVSVFGDALIATGSSSDERLRVTESGSVGIGTLNPSEKLDVAGNININQNAVAVTLTSNGAINIGEIVYVPVGRADMRISKNTTTSTRILGVALSSASSDGMPVKIAVSGIVQIRIDGPATVGHWAKTSSITAGYASSTNTSTTGCLGIFLEGGGVAGDLKWVAIK